MNTTTKEKDHAQSHAQDQARAQLESIKEMLDNLHAAQEDETDGSEEEAREAIEQDALDCGIEKKYFILLCTGGPAVRIVGELNEHNEPESAELQYQDWFTPWTTYKTKGQADDDVLLEYARHYYFGE